MPAASGADGVNVAVLPLTLTAPATAAPPEFVANEKVAAFSVELVIASENVADTRVLSATPVAPTVGDVEDTVGAVVSPEPVIKIQVELAASALPAAS